MTSRSKCIVNAAIENEVIENPQKYMSLKTKTQNVSNNSIKILNNKIFNEIMSNKYPASDNEINVDEQLSENLTEFSRDTTDWLPPNKKNINTKSSTNSSDNNLLNQPCCSKTLVFNNIELTNENENNTSSIKALSEKTHVSESTELDQLEPFPNEFLESSDDEINSNIIFEEISQIGINGIKKKRKTNLRSLKKLNRCSGDGKKVQPNPCKPERCPNKCYEKFTEEERQQIFRHYWDINDNQRQRDFLLFCTKETKIKRKRTKNNTSRRNTTFNYYLSYDSNQKRICQQFLLKTLNITQKFLRYTLSNKTPLRTSPKDGRGKVKPPNKTSDENLNTVHAFIQSLPAVPSHYCRSSSDKKYLPSDISNASRLYLIYTEFCSTNNYEVVSKRVFLNTFNNKYNIGFHKPKKDKCRLCMKYENIKKSGPTTSQEQEDIQKHQIDKENCKDMFLFDQQLSKAMGNYCCTSFDLQKVLNTPYAPNVMNLYYSRKYSFYNCTIYESGYQNAYAYLWGEIDGQRGCNEIVTSVYKYLNQVDLNNKITSIALYSDSCTGQNKNRAMIYMLYFGLKNKFKSLNEIKIVFLIPGHTYMPVDSIHATIERFVKNKSVWAPSEWPTIIRNARNNPRPIEVEQNRTTDILNWKKCANESFPNKVLKETNNLDVKISKIKYLIFNKNSDGNISIQIFYTYRADENPRTLQNPISSSAPMKAYKKKLCISVQKYKDLTKLCHDGIIPPTYHNEYFNMEPNKLVTDCLDDIDEDDECSDQDNQEQISEN